MIYFVQIQKLDLIIAIKQYQVWNLFILIKMQILLMVPHFEQSLLRLHLLVKKLVEKKHYC